MGEAAADCCDGRRYRACLYHVHVRPRLAGEGGLNLPADLPVPVVQMAW